MRFECQQGLDQKEGVQVEVEKTNSKTLATKSSTKKASVKKSSAPNPTSIPAILRNTAYGALIFAARNLGAGANKIANNNLRSDDNGRSLVFSLPTQTPVSAPDSQTAIPSPAAPFLATNSPSFQPFISAFPSSETSFIPTSDPAIKTNSPATNIPTSEITSNPTSALTGSPTAQTSSNPTSALTGSPTSNSTSISNSTAIDADALVAKFEATAVGNNVGTGLGAATMVFGGMFANPYVFLTGYDSFVSGLLLGQEASTQAAELKGAVSASNNNFSNQTISNSLGQNISADSITFFAEANSENSQSNSNDD